MVEWCIPPKGSAAFVSRMEALLDVYARPYDPRRPKICMDETSKQLIADARPSVPVAPGFPAHEDSEYIRLGVRNIFLFCEPLRGWREVTVTEHRTAIDWAQQVRHLLEDIYPEADTVVLILDNLNTHDISSLYAAFPAPIAKRLADRLEIHYTPTHGSWLNIAEIELSILGRQCLDRRIPTEAILKREIAAWMRRQNARAGVVDWQFRTEDARIKLKHLYPIFREDATPVLSPDSQYQE